MVDINKLRDIHIEYIQWLKLKEDEFNIGEYVEYVNVKLNLYSSDDVNKLNSLKSLPRSLNRYLDEFEIDSNFMATARKFIGRMRDVLNKNNSSS